MSGEPLYAEGVNGQVTFDGQMVCITRKGWSARLTVGKGEKRIPVGSVSSVQIKPAGKIINGYIEFSLPGANEVRSQFGQQTKDATKNENAVVFTNKQQPAFERIRDAVLATIAGQHAPAPAATGAAAGAVSEQLHQLASLYSAGALTDDEYAAAKARVLNP